MTTLASPDTDIDVRTFEQWDVVVPCMQSGCEERAVVILTFRHARQRRDCNPYGIAFCPGHLAAFYRAARDIIANRPQCSGCGEFRLSLDDIVVSEDPL